jgi:hypothetical protein
MRTRWPVLARAARYGWAAPYSLAGLLLGGVAMLFGATPRIASGAIEIGGGRLGSLFKRLPPRVCFSAITFGHVILGVDHTTLAQLRGHEQVHVRQYERWGPFYLPAYLGSSLVQLLRGRNPYRDNHFEKEAFAWTAPATPASRRASST